MDKSVFSAAGTPGVQLAVKPDWYVLNDGAAADVPALLEGKRLAAPEKVKVFIDHETPCGSEATAAKQKALIRFAMDNGCELFNGYGISYQLMLDRYVQSGQTIAHCGDFGSIYGYAGALGLRLSPAEMAEALTCASIPYSVPDHIALKLTGALKPPASGKDAALTLLAAAPDFSGKLLFLTGSGLRDMAPSDRASFFQLLSAGGCVAALAVNEAREAAMILDLGAVEPVVSETRTLRPAVPARKLGHLRPTSIFVGGCSSGRIEDIRCAARLVKGRRVCQDVRLLIAFATTEVYVQAANEGLIAELLDAGAIVMNQGCSACYARSQGLADGKDLVLSAGSRSCPNCSGAGDVPTYLCSASTAIASALAGHVCPADS